MPNESGKIRVGIVGLGQIFGLHAKGYMNSADCEVCIICDKRAEMIEKRKPLFPSAQATTDFEELLRSDLDLIEILTPYPMHAEMTCAALRSGANVSVQKPMALSLQEVDSMIEAAHETGNHLRLYENFLHYPPLIKAKELMNDGAIGRPLRLRIHMIMGNSQFAWEEEEASVLWPLELNRAGHGGVMVLDHGWHIFAVALWLFGDVRDVFARIDRTALPWDGLYMDAPASMSWRHVDPPVHANYDCTFAPEMLVRTDYYASNEWIEITGETGIIKISRCSARPLDEPVLSVYSNGEVHQFHNIEADWGESFRLSTVQYLKFLKKEDDRLILTPEEGRKILEMSLALSESSRQEKPIKLS